MSIAKLREDVRQFAEDVRAARDDGRELRREVHELRTEVRQMRTELTVQLPIPGAGKLGGKNTAAAVVVGGALFQLVMHALEKWL